MRAVPPEALPVEVEEVAHFHVPMPDGRRLAARRWAPKDAATRPVPAILEYLPYRKRDGTAERDALTHPYLAGHGYACVRVDIAGTGDSEGLFDDEYSEQEMRDGEAVIAWIAAQPWCSGAVGMTGISWGGFNGLQLAARRPPALKAVVSICSSADRYADDIHYKGGCLLGENLGWAATVLGWFALPPDPQTFGDGWREAWQARLEATPFLAADWTRRSARDDYWRFGSVCEDYGAIEAAVLAVGGWHDGYRNTPFKLLENLEAPCKAILGPWNHKYPHFARPGPTIGFLQEVLRWFDRWLKHEDNGAESDPALRAWLMDGLPPAPNYDERPGRWIAEAAWPAASVERRSLTLTRDGLAPQAERAAPFARTVASGTECGGMTGEFFPFGFGPGELPGDQRPDDAYSACFDAEPAAAATDLLGAPMVRLSLRCDRPRGQVILRLCDVAPNGASALISHGMLDLRHADGHADPRDVEPGETLEIEVALDHAAYRLPQGHRLRLAVSAGYWPFLWPEADAFALTLTAGALEIRIRPTASGDEWRFQTAEAAPPRPARRLAPASDGKRVETDLATGLRRIVIEADHGEVEDLSTGLIAGSAVKEVWSIVEGDPASARVDIAWRRSLRRGGWRVATEARLSQWSEDGGVRIDGRLETFEGDAPRFARDFSTFAPRR